uniref:ADP-ribosylglycohydrolase n=1 Tax=viral metagenome TaxID=1070528 RepID=A0A6C0KI36_9ZZZZ
MNIKQAIENCIVGQAYGDSIGLATEFMTSEQVDQKYGSEKITHDRIVQDFHRSAWEKGDWTDDTDMTILCMRDLVENNGKVCDRTLAAKMRNWYVKGFPELGDKAGSGVGKVCRNVINDKYFLMNPVKSAKIWWKLSHKNGQANGGLMRTSIFGCLPNVDDVITSSMKACKITHYSPESRVTALMISLLIHFLIYTDSDVETCIRQSYVISIQHFDSKYIKKRLYRYVYGTPMDKLIKDVYDYNRKIYSTYKTFICAIWAVRQVSEKKMTFNEMIQQLTRFGHDADTNACVAGAVCGTRFLDDDTRKELPNMVHLPFLKGEVELFVNKIL